MFSGTEGDKFFTVVTVREVIMLFLGEDSLGKGISSLILHLENSPTYMLSD